jgi:hypothetical protein
MSVVCFGSRNRVALLVLIKVEKMKSTFRLISMGFILVVTACNVPMAKPTNVPTQGSVQPTSLEVKVDNTPVEPTMPVVESTADTPAPAAQPEQVTIAEFSEKDACKLITADEASQFLGEKVSPQAVDSPGYSFCTYFTPAGKSLLVSITFGDQVKKNFLNEIGQFQKGCSVSYSGSTRAPTPFPPEIEALMSKSVLDLYAMDLELQEKCGGKVESAAEFGPNAYIVPNAFGIGSIAVISGENYYTFSYGGSNMDISQMVEKTKEVVRAAMAK